MAKGLDLRDQIGGCRLGTGARKRSPEEASRYVGENVLFLTEAGIPEELAKVHDSFERFPVQSGVVV